MEIYRPAEDSYLLSETLKDYLANLINNKNISNVNNNVVSNVSKSKLKQAKKQSSPPHNYNIIKDKNIKILDMGSGSGIQAKTCQELGFKNILTVDINKEAVKLLKKQSFKSIKSDLFSKINKKERFDLIIFNPPYLPHDKLEPKSSKTNTTAGKQGNELIIRFLKQAKSHLKTKAVILLLFSSLSKPDVIKKKGKELGYKFNKLNSKKLFFEELFVYEMSP